MTLTIIEDQPTRLAEYAQVPIGFTVAEVFDDQALAALRRDESAQVVAISPAYWKDYEVYPGGHPYAWSHRSTSPAGAPGMNGDLRIYPKSGYVVAVLSNLDPPTASQVSTAALRVLSHTLLLIAHS
jgi:hypothetical protein